MLVCWTRQQRPRCRCSSGGAPGTNRSRSPPPHRRRGDRGPGLRRSRRAGDAGNRGIPGGAGRLRRSGGGQQRRPLPGRGGLARHPERARPAQRAAPTCGGDGPRPRHGCTAPCAVRVRRCDLVGLLCPPGTCSRSERTTAPRSGTCPRASASRASAGRPPRREGSRCGPHRGRQAYSVSLDGTVVRWDVTGTSSIFRRLDQPIEDVDPAAELLDLQIGPTGDAVLRPRRPDRDPGRRDRRHARSDPSPGQPQRASRRRSDPCRHRLA